jgi:predicted GIY-YIG superfamily endonuclease
MWHLYILWSDRSSKFYIGISEHPFTRFERHNSDLNTGYTAPGRPWVLKGIWEAGPLESDGVKVERFIKKQKNIKIIHHLLNDGELYGPLSHLQRISLQ